MADPLEPITWNGTWKPEYARHLVNRAGFGGPDSLVDRLSGMKAEEAVAHFLSFAGSKQKPKPLLKPGLKEKSSRKLLRGMRRRWLRKMVNTEHPLREKLTLMWHGHFATSAEKVKNPEYNSQLNQIFREHAAGNFSTLLRKVIRSPAMLIYLDNTRNRKGNPNENLARELMELFTMGLGNYTESDIKQAARALTGWTVRNGAFYFNRKQHDPGSKQFLGTRGTYDGDDILRVILNQQATPLFISKTLWEYFAYRKPEERVVKGLAQTMVEHRYELVPVLKQMFLSRGFYSDRARGQKIKSPAELVVGLVHDLNLEPGGRLLRSGVRAMKEMGQHLLNPPNVAGWPGGRAWINTKRLMTRYNTAGRLVLREKSPFKPRRYYRKIRGNTVGETVHNLCENLLDRGLSKKKEKSLVKILVPNGTGSDPFRLKQIPESRLRNVLHTVLASAEYQLC